jgi:hypothetical protein
MGRFARSARPRFGQPQRSRPGSDSLAAALHLDSRFGAVATYVDADDERAFPDDRRPLPATSRPDALAAIAVGAVVETNETNGKVARRYQGGVSAAGATPTTTDTGDNSRRVARLRLYFL